MNKIFRNNRLIAIAFFTAFSVAATPAAIANNNHDEIPVELKFIGIINDQQIFKLNFSGNNEENNFIINLKDESGNILYKENIKGEHFSKKFLFNNDEIAGELVRLEVISKMTNKIAVFEIKGQTRYVDEIVINKIK